MRRTTSLLLGIALLALQIAVYAQDSSSIEQKVQVCFTCHGPDGASQQTKYPILAGQHLHYIYVQLKDFKAGLRSDPEMSPIASTLSKEEMLAIAEYFSNQTWPSNRYETDPEKVKKGEVAASAGMCVQCHLGGYEGNSRIPRLAGLQPKYLKKTMLDFKSKARANSAAKGALMASYSNEDIEALADFVAGF